MLYGEPIGLDDQSEKKTGKLFRSFPRFPPVDLGHGEALVERRERKCTIYAQGMHAWKTGPRIFGHKIALSPRCGKRLNVSRVWRVASPQRAVSTCQGPTAKDREKKSWESSTRPISQSNRLCQRHHRFFSGTLLLECIVPRASSGTLLSEHVRRRPGCTRKVQAAPPLLPRFER